MKSKISYLPPGKQQELALVLSIIQDGFAEAMARRTAPRLVGGRLLKVILFGSYARGDWVDDPIGRYFSDFDILIVVDREELTELEEFWSRTDKRFIEELASGARLRTQPSFIVHSQADLNAQLQLGRFFFLDVVRDGVVLFEEPGHPLDEPRALRPKDALSEAQSYFTEWFRSASQFQRGASFFRSDGGPKEAAFSLHQAAERFYHCLLLVLTLYSPKTHRLNRLREFSEEQDRRLSGVWPRSSKFERQAFDLLRRAYVEARYSDVYAITDEQLAWIDQRIEVLKSIVQKVAEERLAHLRALADADTGHEPPPGA